MKRFRVWFTVLGVLALALVANAAVVQEGYFPVSTFPAAAVAVGSDGADSTDGTSSINTLVAVKGNPTIAIHAEMETASATAVFTVFLWHVTADGVTETLLAKTSATATGGASYTATGGFYPADTLLFDSMGASHFEVRHADPSSASINYHAWAYGASPN